MLLIIDRALGHGQMFFLAVLIEILVTGGSDLQQVGGFLTYCDFKL